MKYIQIILFLSQLIKIILNSCTNYDDDYLCGNENLENERSTWDDRCFQTPKKNGSDYYETYQDMHYLVGYAQFKYFSNKTSCNITLITKINTERIISDFSSDYKLLYNFNDNEQEINYIILNSENNKYPNGLKMSIRIVNSNDYSKTYAKLELEDEYLIWDNPKIIQNETIYENGQKGSIVQLFGWPYEDIEEECDILKIAGYLGVKITPPNEHILNFNVLESGELNPWEYFIQPVSYKLNYTRLGTKKQLKSMINKCRKNGIRIYSQIVINHMTFSGNDVYQSHLDTECTNWLPKAGSSGSPFFTTRGRNESNTYTNKKPIFEYPSVPYCGTDFRCQKSNNDVNNIDSIWVKNTLLDLDTSKDYVRQRIADFLTELMNIGFSGFSIYNGKHISTDDYIEIFKKFKDNLGEETLPDDFILIFEMDLTDTEKTSLLCSNDYHNFSAYFNNRLKEIFSEKDIKKIKFQIEGYGKTKYTCSGNLHWVDDENYIMYVENEKNQRDDEYNINNIIKDVNTHKDKYITMFNNIIINNKIRIVFSSYSLTDKGTGFPDGFSDCSRSETSDCSFTVKYTKAYDPLSIGYDTGTSDNFKKGNYSRIHRDLTIVNSMRKWMNLKELSEEELYLYERYKVYGFPTTIPTIKPTTIPTTKIEYESNCDEKCLTCNEESKISNLCISCNTNKNYFPINYNIPSQKYYDCILRESNPLRFYFNETNKEFRPCYETCLTCNQEGNPKFHNCLQCDADHIFRPDGSPKNNCIAYCEYFYISSYGQYKCLDNAQCPEEAKYLIKAKKQCIDDCKKDDVYKFLYNGNCIQECPENTDKDIVNYLCKESNIYKCKLSEDNVNMNEFKGINNLVKKYIDVFYYTNNHVSQFTNSVYSITIYKNNSCIRELELNMPKVYFGNCYNYVKEKYGLNEDLIVVVCKKSNKNNPSTSYTFYSFYHPVTGENLESETVCYNETIKIEENLLSFLNENDTNYNLMIYLIDQNINIFNISDKFYDDICYEYDNPLSKDIPLQDRIKTLYPNVTLCEDSCIVTGIDIEKMTVICECKFNDIANYIFMDNNNILIINSVEGILDIINESNILVLKCYKYIFKYFSRSIGGFITLSLLIINTVLTIIFFKKELNKVKKYIYDLTENYLLLLNQSKNPIKNDISQPTKKKSKISKTKENITNNRKKENLSDKKTNYNKDNLIDNTNINYNTNVMDLKVNSEINQEILKTDNIYKKNTKMKKKYKNSRFNKQIILKTENQIHNDSLFQKNLNSNSKYNFMPTSNYILKKNNPKINISNINTINQSEIQNNLDLSQKNIKFFEEYLSTNPDEMDYDDAVYKDKRTFWEYFWENFIEDQIITTTFIHYDPLKTRTMKIMIFILDIILIFVFNGLFYSENYISELYNLQKEKFFDFLQRSINRFIYTGIGIIIANFIVDFFFVEEKKIKGIFKREKDDKIVLKEEIEKLIKSIVKRILLFIIIVYVILIISLYYLLCFNYVYPKTQIEWIKSSIAFIIIIQFISILVVLLETCLRFLSFRFKSERIYKISKLIN